MSHYYTPEGEPLHWVPKKDGSGTRPTTIADCRKLGLLPSPTTVLKCLHKHALVEWLCRQTVLAFATAPDVPGETLDQKINRVIDVERQQDQEADMAKDLGNEIHEAIRQVLSNKLTVNVFRPEIQSFIVPVIDWVRSLGNVRFTEQIIVGYQAAGCVDCVVQDDNGKITVIDFKTCKEPTKKAYPEHKMQIAFYADTIWEKYGDFFGGTECVEAVVAYIGKTNPGQVAFLPVEDWDMEYNKFEALLRYWYLSNEVPMPIQEQPYAMADVNHG